MMSKFLAILVGLLPYLYLAVNCQDECCEGWTPFGDTCYQVFYDRENWGEAEIICLSLGGHLASINSDAENHFVATLMRETGYAWVGGHDIVTEGTWEWSDGSSWIYNDWATNYPRHHYSYNCLRFSASPSVGRFSDYGCTTATEYVCEIPQAQS